MRPSLPAREASDGRRDSTIWRTAVFSILGPGILHRWVRRSGGDRRRDLECLFGPLKLGRLLERHLRIEESERYDVSNISERTNGTLTHEGSEASLREML